MTVGATVGATARIFAFIGDPVAQGKLPTRLNAFMAKAGVDAIMAPMRVGATDVRTLFDSLAVVGNYGGAVVTIPHKSAAFEWATRRTRRAEACEVANILYRDTDGVWTADNLDGLGMIGALGAAGVDPLEKTALILGCGGAGAAIAAALAEYGAAALRLHDIDSPRAHALARRLSSAFPDIPIAEGPPNPSQCDIVVNATPMGMADDDPLPIDPARFDPGTVAADAVARFDGTAFLRRAAERGCRTASGLAMVEHQMARVCERFGLPPWQAP